MNVSADRIPYPGPRPFETAERDLFFGRERETRDLHSLVIAHRAVLLYAQSGAGKTSLLKAGLIPLLMNDGIEVMPVARVQGVDLAKLGLKSVENIFAFNALLSWAGDEADPAALASTNLAQYLGGRERARDKHGEPVLRVAIFDQFEELFAAYPEHWKERRALIEQIADACDADRLLHVVLVIREDHLADLDPHTELLPEELRATLRLECLTEEAAIAAVEKPLTGTGRSFAEGVAKGLVGRLLQVKLETSTAGEARVEAQYVEPVQLQVVCRRLWQRLPPTVQVVSDQHLIAFGDVDEALRSFYEDAVSATAVKTGVAEEQLRRWFDGQLITPAGTRGTVFQGATTTGGMPNRAVQALENDHHIVRAELRHGSRWYELTHDRFIAPIRESNDPWLKGKAATRWRRRAAAIAVLVIATSAAAGYAIFQWQQREAVRAIERARVEQADRAPAEGQVARLRTDKNEGRWTEVKAEAVLDGVANYLWAKGEVPRLASLLRNNADLIPNYYGLDTGALRLMPTVDSDTDWPLVVEYSPRAQLDESRFVFHWRSFASEIARTWRIPVPLRVKLRENDNLPAGEFRVLAVPDRDTSAGKKIEQSVPIITDPSQVVVSRPVEPKLLVQFFEEYKLKELTQFRSGEWWLVPAWSQPVWKVAGHSSFDRDGAVALAIASQLLLRPDLVLNTDSVGYLLDQLAHSHPETVREALATRGLDRLTADLVNVVADPHARPLIDLEYLLDSLANRPDATSAQAADQAVEDLTSPVRSVPAALGKWSGREALTLDSIKSRIQPRRYIYEEASTWLPAPSAPIRVYLGERMKQRLAPKDELSPELEEALVELRNKFFRRFGFQPPGVRFRNEETLAPDSFRIEVANQTANSDDAAPTDAPGIGALPTLLRELEFRYVAYRDWWLTPEAVSLLIRNRPEKLRDWLLARYSVTDLKLILRAMIEPTRAELDAYERGDRNVPLSAIRPDGTLDNLDWLLGSLVFSAAIGADETSPNAIAAQLRRLQQSRQTGGGTQEMAVAVGKNVADGIRALQEGRIDFALATFRDAAARDRGGAITAFYALYSKAGRREDTLAEFASACTLPKPGRVATAAVPSVAMRRRIEAFLERGGPNVATDDRRRLELCLLHGAVRDKHHQKAEDLHHRLALMTPQMGWQAEEQYLLAYLLLEQHGRDMSPPKSRLEIEQLLRSAFTRFKPIDAESAILELIKRNDSASSAPRWYVSLLRALPSTHPDNFWVSLDMGSYLTDGRSLDDAQDALSLLKTAQERLASLPPKDRPRLEAWIDLSRANALVAIMDFEQVPGRRAQLYVEATNLIESVLARRPAEAKGWPAVDNLFGALVNASYSADRPDDIARVVDRWLIQSPNSEEAVRHKAIVYLTTMQADRAVDLMQRTLGQSDGKAMQKEQREAILYIAALVETLTGKGKYEEDARTVINETENRNRDFLRLLLYWRLNLESRNKDADELIRERAADIDAATWNERLKQGDKSVWGEQLLSVYAGRMKRNDLLEPIKSKEAFEASTISKSGLTYESISTDAYFYTALLDDVSGDPADHSKRFREGLERASRAGRLDFFETHMARYLLKVTR